MLLQIFLVGNIHFIELLLGSHTAVFTMSPKNAYLYLRSQRHTARTCCCVGTGSRYFFRGKEKFQKLFEEISPSPCLLSTNGHSLPARVGQQFSPSRGSPCNPAEHAAHWGRGALPSVHTCPLSHVHLVQQFIAFQGCSKLRATAHVLCC